MLVGLTAFRDVKRLGCGGYAGGRLLLDDRVDLERLLKLISRGESSDSPVQGCRLMRDRRVLCFGCDAYLLDTRLRVLSLRYNAQGVASVSEMMGLTGEEFDLIVLCHSLTSEQRRAAAAFVRGRWPEAKLVGLYAMEPERDGRSVDAEVQALDGPHVLLRAIDGLLRESLPA